MEALAVAIFLAVAVRALLDYIAAPLRTKFPTLDLWFFDYVALVVGGVVAWFAGIDVFAQFVPDKALLTRILTAFVVGGGAKLLNDIFANAPLADDVFAGRELRGVTIEPRSTIKTLWRPRGW